MLGLIIKDLLVIIKNYKVIQLLILGVIILPISQNPTYMVPILSAVITVWLISLLASSFEYDDQAKWSEQVDFLPVQRKTIVREKYLLGGILCLLSLVLIIFILLFLKAAGIKISISDIWIGIGINLFMSIVYIGIIIPCVYKFGVESSRILLYVIVLLPTLLVGIFQFFHIDIHIGTLSKEAVVSITVFAAILWIIVSYVISVAVYQRKEF